MKKRCRVCKEKFEPRNYWHKYCSSKCRVKAWAMKNFNLTEKKEKKND